MDFNNSSYINVMPIDCNDHVCKTVNVNTANTGHSSARRSFKSPVAGDCVPPVVFSSMTCCVGTSHVVDQEPLTDDEEELWSFSSLPCSSDKPDSAQGQAGYDDTRSWILTLPSKESSLTTDYHCQMSQSCDAEEAGNGLKVDVCVGRQAMFAPRRNRSRLSLYKAIVQGEESSYFTEGFVSVGELPRVG